MTGQRLEKLAEQRESRARVAPPSRRPPPKLVCRRARRGATGQLGLFCGRPFRCVIIIFGLSRTQSAEAAAAAATKLRRLHMNDGTQYRPPYRQRTSARLASQVWRLSIPLARLGPSERALGTTCDLSQQTAHNLWPQKFDLSTSSNTSTSARPPLKHDRKNGTKWAKNVLLGSQTCAESEPKVAPNDK